MHAGLFYAVQVNLRKFSKIENHTFLKVEKDPIRMKENSSNSLFITELNSVLFTNGIIGAAA